MQHDMLYVEVFGSQMMKFVVDLLNPTGDRKQPLLGSSLGQSGVTQIYIRFCIGTSGFAKQELCWTQSSHMHRPVLLLTVEQ